MKKIIQYSLAFSVALCLAYPAASQASQPPHRYEGQFQVPLRHPDGVRITTVAHRSPAARAGLERGDLILRVDGRRISEPEELHRALHRTGYTGTLTIRDARTGAFREVRVYPQAGHIGVNVMHVHY